MSSRRIGQRYREAVPMADHASMPSLLQEAIVQSSRANNSYNTIRSFFRAEEKQLCLESARAVSFDRDDILGSANAGGVATVAAVAEAAAMGCTHRV
jgi:hypothetical protein